MQRGVTAKELKLDEIEQTLAGMSRTETLLLGMSYGVSLRWHYT